MNARYASPSNSVRAVTATIAVATVLALFEFVAGLGDAGAEALAQAKAAQQPLTIASAPATIVRQ